MSSLSAEAVARAAKEAFDASQLLDSSERHRALLALKDALTTYKWQILSENALDVEAARKLVDAGSMSSSLLKRLNLLSSPDKYDSMLQGILEVDALPDPTGIVTYAKKLDDGLEMHRVTCPIGVLLVIFEARPEVIVNIAALAIKSGNAAILKGGKESLLTQRIMSKVIHAALCTTLLPAAYIQTISTRSEIAALLSQDKYIDLIIPRGSKTLVQSVQNGTRIPVMGHADGICAIYLDHTADTRKAIKVVIDSKTSYTAACNSVETLLVHESLLKSEWITLAESLITANVELRCCPTTLSACKNSSIIASLPNANDLLVAARDEDYDTEFMELVLAVKAVPSLSAAINHINTHSSHHTDSVVTEDTEAAKAFCRGVDSAGVFVNASTRFADGFRYGFGTEVGVSTGKTHARGPVGLEGLVIYKYQVKSTSKEGHATTDFGVGPHLKSYAHTLLPMGQPPF